MARAERSGASRLLAVLAVAMLAVAALGWGAVKLINRAIAASESFGFVAAEVRASPQVQARVGRIVSVVPATFGPYSYRGEGDRASVAIRVVASGAACRATVDAEARPVAKNEWNLERLVLPKEEPGAC